MNNILDDSIKVLWFSGDRPNLYIKRQKRGHYIWPNANEGTAVERSPTLHAE